MWIENESLRALAKAWRRSYRKSPAAVKDDAIDATLDVVRAQCAGNHPEADNRRLCPRYQMQVPVTQDGDHNFYLGFSENVSEGGLFVATHAIEPIGSRIDLAFTLPGCREAIHVQGEVRWVREYAESANVPPGMGIQFVQLGEVEAVQIRDFVRRREPIFFED